MKNKFAILTVAGLLLLSLSASVIGFVRSNRTINNPNPTPTKQKVYVKYEYYLEDKQLDQMPEKEFLLDDEGNETTKVKYEFIKYICTNNLSGEFDVENWEFKTNRTNLESTCKLYFSNTAYKANVSVTNGVAEKDELLIDREGSATFKITPAEGYTYKSVTCSNNKETKWDESTKTLTIDVITEDVACKVSFEIMELKVEMTVTNGEGATSEKKKYGESVQLIVTPHDGFNNPEVRCSNDQKGIVQDNKLIIEKLTNNTSCSVIYNKIQPKLYKLKITSIPETVSITSGSQEQNVEAGKDAKISVKPGENDELGITCEDSSLPNITNNPDGTITYAFLNMSKDITCSITATPKVQPPVNPTQPE